MIGLLYLNRIRNDMNSSKHKKIFYPPGIISAVLLPIAFYFFAKREIEKSTVTAIPFFYFDTTRTQYQNYKSFYGGILPTRNYINIVFNGNVHDDQIKLEFAQITIREIITGSDTINALHFLFTDNSRYETVIGLLDKLRMEDAKYYLLYNKDIWFFHRQLEAKSSEYKCLLCNDIVVIQPEISWWTKTKEKIEHVWLSAWQIIVLFFSFIVAVLLLKHKKKQV